MARRAVEDRKAECKEKGRFLPAGGATGRPAAIALSATLLTLGRAAAAWAGRGASPLPAESGCDSHPFCLFSGGVPELGHLLLHLSQLPAFQLGVAGMVVLLTGLCFRLLRLQRLLAQKNMKLEAESLARRAQEVSLAQSEEQMRLFFERQLVGMAITTPKMEWLKVNDKFCQILGYAREELYRLTWAELTHPEDFPADAELFNRLLAGEIDEYSMEKRYLHRDGSIVYSNLSIGCVRNPGGAVSYILALVEDLTERTRAEQELKLKSFTLDTLADPIYWLGSDGRPWDVNRRACTMLGYSKEELLSLHVCDIDPNYPAEMWPEIWEAVKSSPDGLHFESLHRTKDGREIPIEVTTNYFKFNDAEGSCAIIRDLSERRAAEEEKQQLMAQLSQSQRIESIGRLAGGVAHDFNNLLTPIIVYADLLKRKLPAESPDRKMVETVFQAADKARLLTQQLLGFGRKQILSMKTLNLNLVVDSLYDMLRRTIRESIGIELRLSPDPCFIRADQNQVEQILMNLMINAQDAIVGKGKIAIETAPLLLDEEFVRQHPGVKPGLYLMLAVSDNGSGMDQETLSHIFEPFYTTKETGKGTGLGLAMVYGLVKQHGAYIWVDSQEDEGSCFKIYFPLAQEAPPEPRREVEPVSALPRQGGVVLLAEDNEVVRKLVYDLLDGQGFEVLAPAIPEQALVLAKGRHLDLLVTDVVMPGVSGPDLHRQLLKQHPGLKVLYMSGYTNNVIAAHGMLEEGISFIQKPFTVDQMAAKIASVLQQGESRKEKP